METGSWMLDHEFVQTKGLNPKVGHRNLDRRRKAQVASLPFVFRAGQFSAAYEESRVGEGLGLHLLLQATRGGFSSLWRV
jgi:hypothetical protein